MSQDELRIVFKANPTQQRFIESRASADLFTCRMGEGKSAAICWSVFHHTKENPGAYWLIIRDTWVNLRDTTQKEFFKWFPPGIMGSYTASEKKFRWNEAYLKGEVTFMGMDVPADASKLQSRPLGGFALDEPAPAAESGGIDEFIFDTAMTRRRQPGMNWYAAKLAENNPDETHWTYLRFVDEEHKTPGFEYFQTDKPENLQNLPSGYYDEMTVSLRHRPDLVRRFVHGHFGFQRIGAPVTPQWDDDLHLADSLEPIDRDLILLWDFGATFPACTFTQLTPMGFWNVLEAYVGDGSMGAFELIQQIVKPKIDLRYHGLGIQHIGDPAGEYREQSSAKHSCVKVLKAEIGGSWKPGRMHLPDRINPLNWVLSQTRGGVGMVQVDRQLAKPVWYALRGGWHYHKSRTGVVSPSPTKDIHSHPGDTMGYGASRLFPQGRLVEKMLRAVPRMRGHYWKGLGFERPGWRPPRDGQRIEAKGG